MHQAALSSLTDEPGLENKEKSTTEDDEKEHELKQGSFKNCTPLEEIRPLAEIVGGFDLDPCACEDSFLAKKNIRLSGGLVENWGKYETVFANHPYETGEAVKWHKKAYNSDADLIILLSRGSFSSKWFQKHALKADLICVPDSRITFAGHDRPADFPVFYSVYGNYSAELREHFEKKGWVITDDSDAKRKTAGTNEIIVKNKNDSEPEHILPDISKVDELTIEFNDIVQLGEQYLQRATVQPLTRRVVKEPEPSKRRTTDGSDIKTEKDFRDPYFELTCVFTHEDGTESWIVLAQRIEDHEEIYCYIKNGMQWSETDLNRIKTNENFKSTKPSSGMVVC